MLRLLFDCLRICGFFAVASALSVVTVDYFQPDPVVFEHTVEIKEIGLPPLGPYTYKVFSNGGMGTEFIVDWTIISAKHVYVKDMQLSDTADVIRVGTYPRRGLVLAKESPKLNEMVFYYTNRGRVYARAVGLLKHDYLRIGTERGLIVPGDSGSPVFNMRGEVVGVLSFLYTAQVASPFKKGRGGGIALLKNVSDLPSLDEPIIREIPIGR